jgi:hypothetical protein
MESFRAGSIEAIEHTEHGKRKQNCIRRVVAKPSLLARYQSLSLADSHGRKEPPRHAAVHDTDELSSKINSRSLSERRGITRLKVSTEVAVQHVDTQSYSYEYACRQKIMKYPPSSVAQKARETIYKGKSPSLRFLPRSPVHARKPTHNDVPLSTRQVVNQKDSIYLPPSPAPAKASMYSGVSTYKDSTPCSAHYPPPTPAHAPPTRYKRVPLSSPQAENFQRLLATPLHDRIEIPTVDMSDRPIANSDTRPSKEKKVRFAEGVKDSNTCPSPAKKVRFAEGTKDAPSHSRAYTATLPRKRATPLTHSPHYATSPHPQFRKTLAGSRVPSVLDV